MREISKAFLLSTALHLEEQMSARITVRFQTGSKVTELISDRAKTQNTGLLPRAHDLEPLHSTTEEVAVDKSVTAR